MGKSFQLSYQAQINLPIQGPAPQFDISKEVYFQINDDKEKIENKGFWKKIQFLAW